MERGSPPGECVLHLARQVVGRPSKLDAYRGSGCSHEEFGLGLRFDAGRSRTRRLDRTGFGGAPHRPPCRSAGRGVERRSACFFHGRAGEHLPRKRQFMRLGQRRPLTASQQLVNLKANPLTAGGHGAPHPGAFEWRFEVTPSPLSRFYGLRLEYRQGDTPDVYVERPNLKLLADGRRLAAEYAACFPRRFSRRFKRIWNTRSLLISISSLVPRLEALSRSDSELDCQPQISCVCTKNRDLRYSISRDRKSTRLN